LSKSALGSSMWFAIISHAVTSSRAEFHLQHQRHAWHTTRRAATMVAAPLLLRALGVLWLVEPLVL
jgi:hypothetical protein